MTEQSDATRALQNATGDEQKARSKKLLARQVARYLIQNPDFFTEHLELLENIRLPRENGKTVSLMTHQTNLLRERNIEMRQRLDQLLHNARENDQLFRHSRRLILALLEAENVGEATEALYTSFAEDFKVEYTRLILFGPLPQGRHVLGEVRTSSRAAAEAAIGAILRNGRTVCGVLRPAEREYLFDDDGAQVASAAVVPLANQLGVLTVGSSDPQHYRSSLGTLFLSYIGEVLERLLPRLLAP
ncbi:DUF484 family protein [Microbulbifer thermotolerans]|uniref:DUF484 family protein n=1 Tax=Microbulbifer thermotolerans TaxID=252514 RepID=A0AB35HSJ7_MICTH|nr:DUF484 family protein [Microbulbifer thermotolerans]MCX2779095.1 DUF484 family protein [Microbulbifer thermotolerans]MCX2782719.1 DUF484 family protein [Microbulbifer thermotolerans]MCX2800187.1 DUF484 family protein [Microbulbifer thermotolerans]MCX2805273.1 DUF484 family protein [Microbulbifer thermotolerans]MCX2831788.1 DUF484 family protein [Microbulbifer thermotolerans]